MSGWDEYPAYVSVGERRRRNQVAIDRLRKTRSDLAPITIEGRLLAKTWWGKAWNDNLEGYQDFAYRLDRGRSYVRHGAVLDLRIDPGRIKALVQGSERQPYRVEIAISALSPSTWQAMLEASAGQLDSLEMLAAGSFPRRLGEQFTARGDGLFPAPSEIHMHCTCPDWATCCKHVAAALYGVGARLDHDPSLFFLLRQVNVSDLIASAVSEHSQGLLRSAERVSERAIDASEISGLFGIELDGEGQSPPVKPPKLTKPADKVSPRKSPSAKARRTK